MRPTAFITVDPGMNIGWALWDSSQRKELTSPIESGAVVPTSGREWQQSVNWSHAMFKAELLRLVNAFHIELAIMEYPAFFEDATVVAKEGNLVKLCCSAGMVMAAFCELGIPLFFVEVRTWKGQMKKDAVENRIRKRLPDYKWKSSHEMDAVGIGLHAKGLL